MDPTVALREALEALAELHERERTVLPDELPEASAEERDQAVDCLLGLIAWLRGGGDPPDVRVAIDDANLRQPA